MSEYALLKEELAQRRGAPTIIGEAAAIKQVSQAIQRAAGTDTTVLLEGESGTGKELFARALHALSPRANGPFVAINCAAIPDNLLEAELFGYEKGQFREDLFFRLSVFPIEIPPLRERPEDIPILALTVSSLRSPSPPPSTPSPSHP